SPHPLRSTLGARARESVANTWLSQSTTPRPTVLANILYELQAGSPICPSKPQHVQATKIQARVRSVESPPASFRPRRCVENNRLAQTLSIRGFPPFRPALHRLNLRFLQFLEFP